MSQTCSLNTFPMTYDTFYHCKSTYLRVTEPNLGSATRTDNYPSKMHSNLRL